jgi:hypothetical protein
MLWRIGAHLREGALKAPPKPDTVRAARSRRSPCLKASTPEDTSRLIGEAISSGDMDAALSLYEPGATFAMPTAFGQGSVTGVDGLREALSGFPAPSPELTVNAEKTVVSGDTELVIGLGR